MNRKILYNVLMFAVVAILQIYFFDRLPSYSHIKFSFYLTYVVLLSVNTSAYFVLLSSALLGVIIDVVTGTGGLITAAITASAYVRIILLRRMLSEDSVKYSFIPSVRTMGATKWFFYGIAIVLVNALLLAFLESGFLVFVRAAIFYRLIFNIVGTILILYFIQLLFRRNPKSSY